MVLVTVAATGFLSAACEKQTPTTEQLHVQNAQVSQQALTNQLAADPLVQEFILANEKFLTAYDVWYKGLTAEQQAAHEAAVKQAAEGKQVLPDAFRSPAKVQAHHDVQSKIALSIKAKYPAFFALSQEDRTNAESHIYDRIMAQAGMPDQLENMCHAFYSSCSFYGYTSGGGQQTQDACYAGYRACMGSTEEAN